MAKRRKTPDEEYERLAQNLLLNAPNIRDRQSYLAALKEYMGDARMAAKVDEGTWPHVQDIISGKLFRQAGGKSIERDKATLAKTVVETKEEYIKKGSARVDKVGVDTPPKAKPRAVRARIHRKKAHTYSYAGTKKGRVVYARRIITRRGQRYIDSRGQYVRIRRTAA